MQRERAFADAHRRARRMGVFSVVNATADERSSDPAPLRCLLGGDAITPSAEVGDWTREACRALEWHPSRKFLRTIRDYQAARARGGILGRFLCKLAVLRHRFWSVVTGADIPVDSHIEVGLLMPHPNGIVVHPRARIGPNCLLFQQVTIGTGPRPGVPTLAGHVDVGAGAKILGGVHIGAHAVIGANAVVLSDVAAGTMVVGIPAVPVDRKRPVSNFG